MPDILIWQTSLGKKVNEELDKAAPFRCPEEMTIDLVLEFKEDDKILKKLEKDPLLLQQMSEAFGSSPEYKKLVVFFRTALTAVNQVAAKEDDDALDQAEKVFATWFAEKNVKKEIDGVLADMAEKGGEVWTRYCKVKGEYTKYKVKVAARFAMIGVGMGVSVGLNVAVLATSGFHFGAGTVIGIVGLARSTVELVGLVVDCLKGVDTAIAEALSCFYTVQTDFKRKYKGGDIKQATEEIANTLFTHVIGVSAGLKTLSKTKEKLELAQSKLNGTEIALHALSEKLQKTLKKIDKLQAEIKAQEKTPLAERLDKGKLGFDLLKLQKLEDKLNQQLGRIGKAQDMFVQRKKLVDFMLPQVKALLKDHKVQQAAVKVLSGMLTVLDIAASLAIADFTAITDIVGAAATAGELVVDKALLPTAALLSEKVASRGKHKVLKVVEKAT